MATEAKTRNLVLTLELVALVVGIILVLIDYKLKQDLVKLFERIEGSIATASGVHRQDAGIRTDPGSVPSDTVVADNPRVETPTADSPVGATRAKRNAANRGGSANGSGRIGNKTIQDASKSVGS